VVVFDHRLMWFFVDSGQVTSTIKTALRERHACDPMGRAGL